MVVPEPDEHGERFPGLDASLLSRASRIERQLREMDASAASASASGKHTASLAARQQTSESQQLRAARFFATHGLSKVGHLLGDELAASQAAAAQEHATAD